MRQSQVDHDAKTQQTICEHKLVLIVNKLEEVASIDSRLAVKTVDFRFMSWTEPASRPRNGLARTSPFRFNIFGTKLMIKALLLIAPSKQ